jgi:hypothetical protein
MSCCGKQRKQISQTIPAYPGRRSLQGLSTVRDQAPQWQPAVYFEYVGKTGLTAIGPVTGKRYRFNGNGAVVAVDVRDQASLLTVPHLKRLSDYESK